MREIPIRLAPAAPNGLILFSQRQNYLSKAMEALGSFRSCAESKGEKKKKVLSIFTFASLCSSKSGSELSKITLLQTPE